MHVYVLCITEHSDSSFHAGGLLLLEINRILRPGGFFVWSASPVCLECKAKQKDDLEVWEGER